MASINQIKARIKLTKNIKKITNALRLTSSTKMRRLLVNFSQLKDFLKGIYNSLDLLQEEYKLEDGKKTLIYIISSEIGLCGAYNSRIFKLFQKELAKVSNYKIIHIGKKLDRKLKDYNVKKLDLSISNINSFESINIINTEANEIANLLNKKELSRVIIIGYQFINKLIQEPKVYEIIPFQINKDKYSDTLLDATEFEPSKEYVLKSIIPFYLSIALRAAIFESSICIEAMRNLAMDNATNNAQDLIEKLTLLYNRARQAIITQEIIEIVSGANEGD